MTISRQRQYMDCKYCNAVTGHTNRAGCILAVQAAQAANEPIDREQLARDVIALAQVGGMPDSYWLSDSRVSRACAVLGITPEEAREMELPDDDD